MIGAIVPHPLVLGEGVTWVAGRAGRGRWRREILGRRRSASLSAPSRRDRVHLERRNTDCHAQFASARQGRIKAGGANRQGALRRFV